jgi:hypothetical protein
MDVVSAAGFAIHNSFFARVEIVITDGAFSLDRLAVSVLFFVALFAFIFGAWYWGRVAKQIA